MTTCIQIYCRFWVLVHSNIHVTIQILPININLGVLNRRGDNTQMPDIIIFGKIMANTLQYLKVFSYHNAIVMKFKKK